MCGSRWKSCSQSPIAVSTRRQLSPGAPGAPTCGRWRALAASASVAWVLWNRTLAPPEAPTIVGLFPTTAGSKAVRPLAGWQDGGVCLERRRPRHLRHLRQVAGCLATVEADQWARGENVARLVSDGRRIAYTSPVGDVGRQVYEIPALGGLPRRITDGWATDWSIDVALCSSCATLRARRGAERSWSLCRMARNAA